ncbi:MAG: CtsR family transcriptional regulator [Clostridia bacterium]|nr:CtsR family transcriptional regulator [Clostridia bacterium]
MVLSQEIARLIEQMLEEAHGELSIGRNELADRFGCVPSQINYVITSRFTPERGYLVESRRGGGGFIRIRKVSMTKDEYLMHFYQAVGDAIDFESCRAFLTELAHSGVITPREGRLILASLSDRNVPAPSRKARDEARAAAFRNVLLQIFSEKE